MRVQLVIALVVGLVLVAVPLYLWRRPKSEAVEAVDAATASAMLSASRPPSDPAKVLLAAALDGGVETEAVKLGRVWVDSCQRAGSKTAAENCDRQPFFEEALVKAVLENTSCAPKASKGGTISYALRIDYREKSFRVFPGKSGTLRRNQAKEAVACVQRAIPRPNWETLPHQHTKYIVAVLATYPPTEASKP